jgi:hypothetical protein
VTDSRVVVASVRSGRLALRPATRAGGRTRTAGSACSLRRRHGRRVAARDGPEGRRGAGAPPARRRSRSRRTAVRAVAAGDVVTLSG